MRRPKGNLWGGGSVQDRDQCRNIGKGNRPAGCGNEAWKLLFHDFEIRPWFVKAGIGHSKLTQGLDVASLPAWPGAGGLQTAPVPRARGSLAHPAGSPTAIGTKVPAGRRCWRMKGFLAKTLEPTSTLLICTDGLRGSQPLGQMFQPRFLQTCATRSSRALRFCKGPRRCMPLGQRRSADAGRAPSEQHGCGRSEPVPCRGVIWTWQ